MMWWWKVHIVPGVFEKTTLIGYGKHSRLDYLTPNLVGTPASYIFL